MKHRAGRSPRATDVALTRPARSLVPGPSKAGAIAGDGFQAPNPQPAAAHADRLDTVARLAVGDGGRQVEAQGQGVARRRLIGLGDHQIITAPIVDGAREPALHVERIAGHDRAVEVTIGKPHCADQERCTLHRMCS